MIEHHIQVEIINKLSRTKSLRFSELKPREMDSNIFMYHLKQLMCSGYVEQQSDKSYLLTSKGLTYVDGLTLTNNKPRKQPKLVSIIAIQNSLGEWLLAKRKLQPYFSELILPSGKQHFGESADEQAKRELKEQCKFDITLTRRGLCEVRVSKGSVLLTHIVAHVYYGSHDGAAPGDGQKFSYEWTKVTDNSGLVAGTYEICQQLNQSKEFFYLSLDGDDD